MRKLVCLAGALALVAVPAYADVIGGDDFDGGGIYMSRTILPDNSALNGQFPSSYYDVFGITDRTVNYDFADDSAGSYPADTFGVLKTGKLDHVFGVEDLTNPDNPGGTGIGVWEFNIDSFFDIFVEIDFAAMGDFEASNDSYVFTARIDGGAPQVIFASTIREDLDPYSYYLESGTQININDPVEVNGVIINNNFQTLGAAVSGTGSVLTLTFDASNDGGSEVFIFDNIVVNGVPEPTSLLLLGLGGLFLRRR
ncbi:MAG: PEP-CTERM sorting domain-containing protein [Planctomycetes bacterium]|nr:PEP-CTERM sorting domain-containing protein [Planctomycetota bacterium]